MMRLSMLAIAVLAMGGSALAGSAAEGQNKPAVYTMEEQAEAVPMPMPPPMHKDPMPTPTDDMAPVGPEGPEMERDWDRHDGHMHHHRDHDHGFGHHDHDHDHGHGHGRMHGHGCHMGHLLAMLAFFGLAITLGIRVANRQGFSTPAHGCFSDMPSCFLTTCCPCVTYGRVAEFSLGVPWYLMCCAVTCCNNFRCCFGLVSRYELRRKLDIDGHWCGDACVHAVAQPCALCQELREIDMVANGERAGQVVTAVPANTFQVQLPEGAVPGQQMQVNTPSGRVAFTVPQGVTAGSTFNIQVNTPAAPATQAMDIEMQNVQDLSKPLMV